MLVRLTVAALMLASPVAVAADNPAEGVKKVELTVEPADAKPGQTVTLKLTVTLNPGCHTYPFMQADKNAESFVSKAKFPASAADGLIYVGDVTTTAPAETKSEPVLGIKEMKTYSGTVTFEKKAVVSPKATGPLTAKFASLKLNVCDAKDCFKPTELKPETKLAVSGSPVEVEKEFAETVKKALDGK